MNTEQIQARHDKRIAAHKKHGYKLRLQDQDTDWLLKRVAELEEQIERSAAATNAIGEIITDKRIEALQAKLDAVAKVPRMKTQLGQFIIKEDDLLEAIQFKAPEQENSNE